jgi:prepilin-type N-terminal cleavage/methylation domain-containing protein
MLPPLSSPWFKSHDQVDLEKETSRELSPSARPASAPRLLSRSRRGEAGFTLIELTIGAALMALILASAYACLSSGLAAQRLLEPRLEAFQSARVALRLMTADLRAACPLSKEADFVGIDRTMGNVEADNVDFGTLNYTPTRPGEGDFCQTSYYLDQDPETGDWLLWRRRNPRIGVDPFSGGTREEIARGVRQLKLEYYDGFDWFDTWGDAEGDGQAAASSSLASNLSGMPEAVRITLAFSAGERTKVGEGSTSESGANGETEPPLVYQTVVRLNAVGASASASGGSATTGSGNTPTPPNAGGAPGSRGAAGGNR